MHNLRFRTFVRIGQHLKCILFFCGLLANSMSGAYADSYDTQLKTASSQMGRWIWTDTTQDNQTCRLWRSFDIPEGVVITHATLHITVDNGYRLLLDGEEIGRGSDWRCIAIYDLTWMLQPGHHVLAVEAYNDTLQAGLICGLNIEFLGRDPMKIISDETWRIPPNLDPKWAKRKQAQDAWPRARIVGEQHTPPWDQWPKTISIIPPMHPVVRYFWQSPWFQLTMVVVCGVAILAGVWLATRLAAQAKAQRLLHQERVRLAQDIHDDIGSRVTELLLLGEVSRREASAESAMSDQIRHICDQARGLALALDEVVWAVNAKRDTVKDFVSYVCKHAQNFLKTSDIRCGLDVETNIPADALALYVRRNLFLAVKEALNNAAKHSQATELCLRIYRRDHSLFVEVADNGRGFEGQAVSGAGNGLANMWQRMGEINGTCEVFSEAGAGCRVVFSVPMQQERSRWWHLRRAAA